MKLLPMLLLLSLAATLEGSIGAREQPEQLDCEQQIAQLLVCQQRLLNDHGERRCGMLKQQRKLNSASSICVRIIGDISTSNCISRKRHSASECREGIKMKALEAVCRRLTDMEREAGRLVKILRQSNCNISTPTTLPAQTLIRTRRNAQLPQCDDSSCNGVTFGFNKLQRNMNNMPILNAAIKATVSNITYGNTLTIMLDEMVQIYPNDTRLITMRRMRLPLNCSCTQLKNNTTYLLLGFFNQRYHFQLYNSTDVGRIVYDADRENFKSRPLEELKEKIFKIFAKRANTPASRVPSRGKRKAPNNRRQSTG